MNFFFLTVILVLCGMWTAFRSRTSNSSTSLIEKGIAIILIMTAFAFTAFPLHTAQPMAELFGIGRGADFIIYTYILFSLITIQILYRKSKLNSHKITVLMQEVSLLNEKLTQIK